QKTDFRDLSWPPNSRVRIRWIDLKIEIWASRREPAGERFGQRQSGDHGTEPRLCGRSGVTAVKCRSHANKSKSWNRGRNAAQGVADLQRAIPSRGRARSA